MEVAAASAREIIVLTSSYVLSCTCFVLNIAEHTKQFKPAMSEDHTNGQADCMFDWVVTQIDLTPVTLTHDG